MFQTTRATLEFLNFTVGRVRGVLDITNVDATYEGIYSCVFADMDLSSRLFSACLFVLGKIFLPPSEHYISPV